MRYFSFPHVALFIVHLTYVRIRTQVKRFSLGIAWWFLDPLINTLVLFVVTVVILEFRSENMAIFLLCGLLMFRFLQSSIAGACNSLDKAISLSNRLYIPKYVFVIRDVLADFTKFVVGIIILGLLVALLGVAHPSLLEIVFVSLIALIFTAGLAPFVALTSSLVSDVRMVVQYTFRLLFFVSGIFFPLERVPEAYRELYLANPFALLIHEFRVATLWQTSLAYDRLLVLAFLSTVLGGIGYALLFRYDRILPKYVI